MDDIHETPLVDFMWLHTNLAGNTDLIKTLLGMFVEMLDQQETLLGQAYDPDNLAPVQKQLHSLKGTAATVGATPVRECAMALEALCKENQAGALQERLPELYDLAQRTRESVQQFMAAGMPFPV